MWWPSFGADHIYRMNIMSHDRVPRASERRLHRRRHPCPKEHAFEFGVIETDERRPHSRLPRKESRRPHHSRAPRLMSSPPWATICFPPATLLNELQDDAANEDSSHDFGRDILPSLVQREEVYAYDFQTNKIPGEPPGPAHLLARRRNHRRLLRSQHGSARRLARH